MTHIISTQNKMKIEVGATGLKDILQCVYLLITTIKGTIAFDRNLGISPEIIDQPSNKLDRLYEDIYFSLEEYEPRANLKSINTKVNDLTGEINIIVEVDIDEEFI